MNLNLIKKLDIIAQAAQSNRYTVYFSYEATHLIVDKGILGDLVECGVYAGAQCAAMALALQNFRKAFYRQEEILARKVHLFDSFEGIPQAGEFDPPSLTGQSVSSLENTKKFMDEWGIIPELLVYHKGLFKDTVPNCGIEEIAVLRLDGDLYESTKICLEHLYPKLSPDGICIIDDWSLPGCRKAVTEYFGETDPEVIVKKLKMQRISGDDGPVYFVR